MTDTTSTTKRITLLLCTVQFLDVLGVTLLNVALPVIQRDLNATGAEISLIAGLYALCFGAFLVPAGRIADLVGYRRMLSIGLALLLLASLLGGFATAGPTLIAARAVQGLAAAIAVPAALSLLTKSIADGPSRNTALGIWTATGAVGGASGFAIGGLLTDLLSWRSLFLLNVPLIVITLAVVPRVIPDIRSRADRKAMPDMGTLLLLPIGLFLLINGVSEIQTGGLTSPRVWLQVVVGCALLFATYYRNARVNRPLVPPAILANAPLLIASLVAAAITFVTSATGTLLTFWLQDVRDLSPSQAGLTLMLMSLGVVVGSRLGSNAMGRCARMPVIVIGLTGLALSAGLFVVSLAVNTLWIPCVALMLAGGCLGWTSVASTALGLSTIADDVRGIASGVLSAAAPVGTAIGISIVLTGASVGETLTGSMVTGMQIGLAITVIPLLLALLTLFRYRPETQTGRT